MATAAQNLAAHLRGTIGPLVHKAPNQPMTANDAKIRAIAAIGPSCVCAGKDPKTVCQKLDELLRARGYPPGSADRMLAELFTLNQRIDQAAAKNVQKAPPAVQKLHAKAQTLPLHHPTRCRAARLVLTCTP